MWFSYGFVLFIFFKSTEVQHCRNVIETVSQILHFFNLFSVSIMTIYSCRFRMCTQLRLRSGILNLILKSPYLSSVIPCALWIVMLKAGFKGNCTREATFAFADGLNTEIKKCYIKIKRVFLFLKCLCLPQILCLITFYNCLYKMILTSDQS